LLWEVFLAAAKQAANWQASCLHACQSQRL